MSALTTTYASLVSKVESTLDSDYVRLPDSWDLEDNTELLLRKGWAITFGAASNSERFMGCYATWIQEYGLVLVNQIESLEHDATGIADGAVNIMDDVYNFALELEKDPNLGNSDNIKSVAVSTGGVDILEGERDKFLVIELSIEVELIENVTT